MAALGRGVRLEDLKVPPGFGVYDSHPGGLSVLPDTDLVAFPESLQHLPYFGWPISKACSDSLPTLIIREASHLSYNLRNNIRVLGQLVPKT